MRKILIFLFISIALISCDIRPRVKRNVRSLHFGFEYSADPKYALRGPANDAKILQYTFQNFFKNDPYSKYVAVGGLYNTFPGDLLNTEEIYHPEVASSSHLKRYDGVLNANFLRAEINNLLSSLKSQAQENDLSIISISSHGAFLPEKNDSCFVMSIGDKNNKVIGTPYYLINDFMQRISEIKGQKLVILDLCNSGSAISTDLGLNHIGSNLLYEYSNYPNTWVIASSDYDKLSYEGFAGFYLGKSYRMGFLSRLLASDLGFNTSNLNFRKKPGLVTVNTLFNNAHKALALNYNPPRTTGTLKDLILKY